MNTAVFILGAVLLVAFLRTVIKKRNANQFRQNEGDPWRRYCVDCGQQQNEYHSGLQTGTTWWQDVPPILDPNCRCHKLSKQMPQPGLQGNEQPLTPLPTLKGRALRRT